MTSQSQRNRMRNRGILTREDREAFQSDGDVDAGRLQDIRWNIRQRMDRIERDIQILRDAGEEELIEDFYDRFSREARLERRIDQLEQRVEEN